ncbi:hypothetical protein P4O66_002591 [Electrophorus voltai]|uniref:Apple domain-containing protein n=1 Tax=Electrophorus voltai TaxID=2609070 RepID=A0AAD8YXC7_9TELE|nr:hypothetical protein P4O66_002591 [Electrophorus voltai]
MRKRKTYTDRDASLDDTINPARAPQPFFGIEVSHRQTGEEGRGDKTRRGVEPRTAFPPNGQRVVQAETRCESRKQTLQRYQKSEDSRLVCSSCGQTPRVRRLALEDCARKCSKSKKSCRAFNYDHINRTCHLLSFDRFADGVQKERRSDHDLYEQKDYVRECIVGSGVNYKGIKSVTRSGISCQAWNVSVPHEHK